MKLKNILIVIPAYNHGGTNRSLLNLLGLLDRSRFTCHILSLNPNGPYKKMLGAYTLLPEDPVLSALMPVKYLVGRKCIRGLFWKFVYKLFWKSDENKLFDVASKKYSQTQYDAVIAFQEGRVTQFVSRMQAKKRISWVHCDYSSYQKMVSNRDESAVYEKIDQIICVSNYTAEVFRNIYPSLASRTQAIHNLIDTESIICQSAERTEDSRFVRGGFTLISVGRMDPVKRFSHIPAMAQRMKQSGCSFKWYIVGDGGTEFDLVQENIKKHAVEDEVILLGAKDNPYPYIANADVLVCPSYTEACPNVVNEAKILHVPVIAADFPSASEYIENTVNGIIAPLDEIADVLIRLCNDRPYFVSLKEGIASFEYQNETILKQIENLLDGNPLCLS